METIVHVNSRDRIDGTRDSFTCKLAQIVRGRKITLHQMMVPVTWYQISEGRDTIYIDEAGTIVPVTITHGTYNIDDLCVRIGNAMTAASTEGRTYSCTYTPETDSIRFGRNGGVWKVRGDVSKLNNQYLLEMLGFELVESINAPQHFSVTSPQVSPPNNLYLYISSLGVLSCDSNGSRNILAKIPIRGNWNTVQFLDEEELATSVRMSGEFESDVLEIRLVDERNRSLGLRSDWTLSLKFSS